MNQLAVGMLINIGELSELFSCGLAEKSKQSAVVLGQIAGMYDHLLDSYEVKEANGHYDTLDDIIRDKEYYGEIIEFKAFEKLYRQLTVLVGEENYQFWRYLGELKKVQKDSINQKGRVNGDDLVDITRRKGGYAYLLAASLFGVQFTKEQEEALFEYGYLFQLVDDFIDAGRDRQDGIRTLFTDGTVTEPRLYLDGVKEEVYNRLQRVFGKDCKPILKYAQHLL